jgi:hypothetical protein
MAREPKDHELHSPVDISDAPIEAHWPLAWTSVTILVAGIVLLFANAGSLSAWVDERPPSDFQLQASDLTNRWTAAMDALGITTPRHELHAVWKKAQAARFGGEAPTATQ